MKTLIKVGNSEIVFRVNLNYNNVYARLRILLGEQSSLFADIQAKSKETVWFAPDNRDYFPVFKATAKEKEEIATFLKVSMESVRKKIEGIHELEPYINDLLEVPGEEFIFYTHSEEGKIQVVLTAWGCRTAHVPVVSGEGIISGFVSNILTVRQEILLQVVDADGHRVYSGVYQFDYGEVHSLFTMDKSGRTKLGILPVGSIFYVTDTATNEKQGFEVQKECSLYEFRLKPIQPADVLYAGDGENGRGAEREKTGKKSVEPTEEAVNKPEEPVDETTTRQAKEEQTDKKKLQSVSIRLLDQNHNPVTDRRIEVEYQGVNQLFETDAEGQIAAGDMEIGKTFTVSFPVSSSVTPKVFEVEYGKRIYDMYVRKLVQYSPILFVEDKEGNIMPERDIKVIIAGKDSVYNTGTEGVIQLPVMNDGQKFIVIDTYNPANSEEFIIHPDRVSRPYHFQVEQIREKKVHICLLDKNDIPVLQAVLRLRLDGKYCHQTTDAKGIAEFPYHLFHPGVVPVEISLPGKEIKKGSFKFRREYTDYTLRFTKKILFPWKWMVLPLLFLLLAVGGYFAWQYFRMPSYGELEKGIVLLRGYNFFYVDPVASADGTLSTKRFFFNYDENKGQIGDYSWDFKTFEPAVYTGTGFFISKDGEIATNRHVAAPRIPKKEAIRQVKRMLANDKQKLIDSIKIGDKILQRKDLAQNERIAVIEKQKEWQKRKENLQSILDLNEFEVKRQTTLGAAFVNSIIDDVDDFYDCVLRITNDDENGNVDKADVAIIQLKEKGRIMPKDAYIFKVPAKDPLDGNIGDEYNIHVLGYNDGAGLANIKEGIHPQRTDGKITENHDRYRVMYSAATLGGSSGSPVLNDKRELVAVNNSGIGSTQGFNFGVRLKYLKELYDKLHK